MNQYHARTGRWSRSRWRIIGGRSGIAPTGDRHGDARHHSGALGWGQLLVMDQPVSIEISEPIEQDEQGRWWRTESLGRVSYRAWSDIEEIAGEEPEPIAPDDSIDPRIGALAHQWMAEISAGSSIWNAPVIWSAAFNLNINTLDAESGRAGTVDNWFFIRD